MKPYARVVIEFAVEEVGLRTREEFLELIDAKAQVALGALIDSVDADVEAGKLHFRRVYAASAEPRLVISGRN